MANRRDLHIGITGDSAGFDKACQDAEEKARGLDKELVQLERQQAAQEKVTTRTAAAIKKYGSEQDKAALAARRLGTEAEKAAKQAEQAQVRAAAAADAYSRGLIDEQKSLNAAARAEDAIERAAIKAAEAHRAAAKAAEDQAQQERQLARDAELGAAAENLAVLKASGRVKEHNVLLDSMKTKYGDVSKTAIGGFETIETTGTKAAASLGGLVENFSVLGTSGPVAIGLVVAAIELLPTVATIAGGAVALGLGGALALAAIKAQSSASDVQAAFSQLKTGVLGDLREISAPFHATLLEIASDAQYAFKSLEPSLAAAFALMGPAISRFVRNFAGSMGELDPAIRSIGVAFTNVLDTLGPEMPTIIQNISVGIRAITDAVAANPQALASFVVALSNITRNVGDSIGFLIRYANQINAVYKVINAVAGGGNLIGALMGIASGAKAGGKAIPPYTKALGDLNAAASSTDAAHQQLAKDMSVLASATKTAEEKTTALSDAFTKFLDPQQAVFKDTAQLQQGMDGLGTALARSGGKFGDASQSARDATTAFNGLLDNAQQLATDMTASGQGIDVVRRQLMPYISALYQAAGSNDQARKLVDAFVKTLGMIPPAVDASGRMISGFSGKVSTLTVPMSAAQLSSRKLAEDFQTLTTSTASAEDKANALSDAFTRLLDPALAAYQDTSKLRQGFDDLAAALKKSHGALGDNSAAARASKDAFAGLLKDAEQFAGDLLRSGDTLDTVQRKLTPYILGLYKAAGANKDARALVDAFARSVGLVPNKKGTTLTSNAAAQKKAIEAYQRSIDNLKGKTVDIYQVMHLTTSQAYLNKRKNILGYASGGLVQHLADGGPSGAVSGPGTGTSDSILTALSNGEFVVNAAATSANRPLLEAINSGARVPAAPAVMSGASGGSSPGVDVGTLARAVSAALNGVTVQMDSKPVGQIVSKSLGRSTDQRRRTG